MNQQQPQEQTVPRSAHVIERGPLEQIRFCVAEYKGTRYLDLRTYYLDDALTWKPTRKGISLSLDQLDDLERAVAALRLAVAGEQEQEDAAQDEAA